MRDSGTHSCGREEERGVEREEEREEEGEEERDSVIIKQVKMAEGGM